MFQATQTFSTLRIASIKLPNSADQVKFRSVFFSLGVVCLARFDRFFFFRLVFVRLQRTTIVDR
jgi:hypothetical protein